MNFEELRKESNFTDEKLCVKYDAKRLYMEESSNKYQGTLFAGS